MSTPPVIHDCGRRFHRTTAEAFKDAKYACAIERHRTDPADRIVLWGCAAAAVCFVVLLLAGWLPA